MNGTIYSDVLRGDLKESMSVMPNKNQLIFRHDLASWHTSNVVEEAIKKMMLNVLNWAPKSPDLNPIEML
jgi:transposase